MITDCGVDIEAPAAVVWDVFSDVERWPEWTASVTRLVALGGARLAAGKVVGEATDLTPGEAWPGVQRSPGVLTVARHEVIPESDRRTRVQQQLDQRGAVGAMVGLVMGGMAKRSV